MWNKLHLAAAVMLTIKPARAGLIVSISPVSVAAGSGAADEPSAPMIRKVTFEFETGLFRLHAVRFRDAT
jgi:hypothetical protein